MRIIQEPANTMNAGSLRCNVIDKRPVIRIIWQSPISYIQWTAQFIENAYQFATRVINHLQRVIVVTVVNLDEVPGRIVPVLGAVRFQSRKTAICKLEDEIESPTRRQIEPGGLLDPAQVLDQRIVCHLRRSIRSGVLVNQYATCSVVEQKIASLSAFIIRSIGSNDQ